MISYIKWLVKNIDLNSVIVLTQSWVWYEVLINELIYSKIFDKNEIEFYVYHSISENWQSLFGFLNIDDRILFKELIKISWVWWKVAQSILNIWWDKLKKAILENDKSTIESAKWVWKKMAEKIIIELSDKDIVKNVSVQNNIENININKIEKDIKNEIVSTLTMMWYNSKKVEDIFNTIPENLTTIEKIIPYIIKNI